ncbi:MAG: hypothetical protein O2807_05970 [bacterium]|nr:hypothetical protein [bacterium]
MKKITAMMILASVFLVMPVSTPVTGPAVAAAAEKKADFGSAALDVLIVRPVQIVIWAGALITYPVAALLDPLFNDDPKRLKKEWLNRHHYNAFERKIGDFDFQ